MFHGNISGFKPPSDGSKVAFLPIALDKTTWDALLAGGGTDNWTWNAQSETVTAGADGILELNLYPRGSGAPGNRGMVNIGRSNNSTAEVARQIVEGLSEADFAFHGGSLEIDSDTGQLMLNGDPGISAGMKDELASIIGRPTVVPIFNDLSGNGNNAEYTIVEFGGIRIMEVQLTGNNKRVMIQPSAVSVVGAIPDSSGNRRSNFISSPVWLVR